MDNETINWTATGFITCYYANSLTLIAESLEKAIEKAFSDIRWSKGPSNGRRGNSNVFAEDTTKISYEVTEQATECAAIVVTAEVAVVGGMTGREAIYVINKKGSEWQVKCIEFYKISSDGPYVRLSVNKIENGLLSYYISKENPEDGEYRIR